MRFRMGGIDVLRCGIVDYRVMAESMKDLQKIMRWPHSPISHLVADLGYALVVILR